MSRHRRISYTSPQVPLVEVVVLNQTEISYACQEALGGPYRRPIFTTQPQGLPPATPELLAAMWRRYGTA